MARFRRRILFEFSDLKIFEEGARFFVVYDAGAHKVVMRQDEISEQEAVWGSFNKENAIEILGRVQRRLLEGGVDPHVSNIKDE